MAGFSGDLALLADPAPNCSGPVLPAPQPVSRDSRRDCRRRWAAEADCLSGRASALALTTLPVGLPGPFARNRWLRLVRDRGRSVGLWKILKLFRAIVSS